MEGSWLEIFVIVALDVISVQVVEKGILISDEKLRLERLSIRAGRRDTELFLCAYFFKNLYSSSVVPIHSLMELFHNF